MHPAVRFAGALVFLFLVSSPYLVAKEQDQAVPFPVVNYLQSVGVMTTSSTDWLNQNAQMTAVHDPANPGAVTYIGGGFGPLNGMDHSFNINTTFLQTAPPGVQQWWAANQPGSNYTYGSPAYQELYQYMIATATMSSEGPFLTEWGNIATMSNSDIFAQLQGNLPEYVGVMNKMTSMGVDVTTDAGMTTMVNYMKAQVAATQSDYDSESQRAANFIKQQQALAAQSPDWGNYGGHWLDEMNADTSADAVAAAQMTADFNALMSALTADLAALPGGTDPTVALSDATTVATLAPIYQNYVVTPGQGGSSVIQMGTTQITVPSDQITIPSNQVKTSTQLANMPSAVMNSLNLQALCGR